MTFRALLLTGILASAAAWPVAAFAVNPNDSKSAESAPLTVTNSLFGLFNTVNGEVKFAPGRVVPLVEGQSYGWMIQLKTAFTKVRWREELTLPQAPSTWGIQEPLGKRELSSDARTSVTERVVEPVNGLLFNAWGVAKGDPPGPYRIRVFVEGRLVATYDFEVK